MAAVDAPPVAAWRYPGEYSFYDADADPDDLAKLLDPAE
jgi:[ribosomal protein S18]-alanine N-acetyltransferase